MALSRCVTNGEATDRTRGKFKHEGKVTDNLLGAGALIPAEGPGRVTPIRPYANIARLAPGETNLTSKRAARRKRGAAAHKYCELGWGRAPQIYRTRGVRVAAAFTTGASMWETAIEREQKSEVRPLAT